MPKRSDYVQEIPKFRSRYTEEDTSHLLPENQPKPNRPWWWKLCCFLCTCCCKCSRRQLFLSTTIILVAYATFQNASAIRHFINDNSTALSLWQSYGLIDETNHRWMDRQEYWHQTHGGSLDELLPKESAEIVSWYNSNWNVNFECPHEQTIGSYTMCGATSHLQHKHNCLIYSSDPPNRLLLEKSLRPLIHKSCEIHVFDPTNTTSQFLSPSVTTSLNTTNPAEEMASILLHPWGFTKQANSNISKSELQLLSISDTMEALNHQGRTIDLFVLNCAGCEWNLFPELLEMDMGQLLIEVHGGHDNMTQFFQQVEHHRFVTFHKEPVRWDGTWGLAQIYSFLKLRKGFFATR